MKKRMRSTGMIWRKWCIASGWYEKRMNSSYSSKSSWCKTPSAAMNWRNSIPQSAVKLFAFTLVQILLLCVQVKLSHLVAECVAIPPSPGSHAASPSPHTPAPAQHYQLGPRDFDRSKLGFDYLSLRLCHCQWQPHNVNDNATRSMSPPLEWVVTLVYKTEYWTMDMVTLVCTTEHWFWY